MNKVYAYSLIAVLWLCATPFAAAQPAIIPQPQSYVEKIGTFQFNRHTQFYSNAPAEELSSLTDALADWNLVEKPSLPTSNAVCLIVKPKVDGVDSPEGYSLTVTHDRITAQATSADGLFYAVQTLRQLRNGREIRQCIVTDSPRLPYRGLMIDVSRHFFPKEFLLKQLDAMAHFKLNRLHLHLTDAAGWRIEIKKYPRLTQLGAWRNHKDWKTWWNTGRLYSEEGSDSAFGGYYTQQDIRDIVAYARQRHITVIPEIEMPAHSEEALTAYPELSCTHQLYKQADFCPGNEKTFSFLEDVLTEVMALFPSEYIHVGGDEAGRASWPTCPLCQKRMKDEGLTGVEQLQSYLIHRIERFLNAHGRKLLGWDEILDGGLAPNATVMSWRGEDGGRKAVEMGHRAIMSPGGYCYLDSYQDAPPYQPEAIGGFLPLKRVYSYNPIPAGLTKSQADLIYGVQGNLWTEYVPTPEHAEMMLYPRALAIAEIGWTQPAQKSWERFHANALKAVDQLKKAGYHPFNLSKEYGNRKEYNTPILHLAFGKKVTYNAPYNENYRATGDSTLTDGRLGNWTYSDGRWQGFISGRGLDVTIDLGRMTDISSVTAEFMQSCGPEVYFPEEVIVSVSADSLQFTTLSSDKKAVVKDEGLHFERRGWHGENTVRYIRFQALPGKQFGGWVFTDEIVIK